MTQADDALSRQRGVAAGQAAQQAARATARRERRCYFCGADISHRRRDAWSCGVAVHGQSSWHARRRRLRQAAMVVQRPRCMICDTPLDPKRKGVTCSRACAIKRHNWYVRG